VLDFVVSHQGAPLKCALLQRLMSALVLPAPEHYRAQLRRLAALGEPSVASVAQRAQQLLEHSLLGELRSLVARALSGLDMFAEPQLRELFGGAASPTPLGPQVRGLGLRRLAGDAMQACAMLQDTPGSPYRCRSLRAC
jgi:hypothetical protein